MHSFVVYFVDHHIANRYDFRGKISPRGTSHSLEIAYKIFQNKRIYTNYNRFFLKIKGSLPKMYRYDISIGNIDLEQFMLSFYMTKSIIK